MCSIHAIFFATLMVTIARPVEPAKSLQSIPDRLVVLTFDDASRSHFTVARAVLKQYEFGATFFITEGFDFKTNKEDSSADHQHPPPPTRKIAA